MRIVYAVFTISVVCVIFKCQQLFTYVMFRLNEIRPILFFAETFVPMSTGEERLSPQTYGGPVVSLTLDSVSVVAKVNRQDVNRRREETKTENYKNKRDVYEIIIGKHYDINPQLWRLRALGRTQMHSLIVFSLCIILLTGSVNSYKAAAQQLSRALLSNFRCLQVYPDLVGETLFKIVHYLYCITISKTKSNSLITFTPIYT